MQLDIRDVQVDKLLLHEGGSTSEYSHFIFHGRSDGRHHEAAIEQLDTPFGAVTAAAKLDGVRPFPLTGDIGYSGKVNEEPVQVSGHLSGTLETLVAELDASGMKLAGHARVEATPFADVPLQRATLTFDHINPQAFAPGAPLADLAVRAELQPVAEGGAEGAVVPARRVAQARTAWRAPPLSDAAAAASATNAAANASPTAGFVVAGHVSIVNAKPGAIDQNLLPLIDAHTRRAARRAGAEHLEPERAARQKRHAHRRGHADRQARPVRSARRRARPERARSDACGPRNFPDRSAFA